MKTIKSCNLNHFLYITSLCLDTMINDILDESYLNKEKILCYLDDVKMNGLLFSLINPDVFALSIQKLMTAGIYTRYEYLYKRYGGKLYDEILEYDLKKIKSASICNIKFTEFSKV